MSDKSVSNPLESTKIHDPVLRDLAKAFWQRQEALYHEKFGDEESTDSEPLGRSPSSGDKHRKARKISTSPLISKFRAALYLLSVRGSKKETSTAKQEEIEDQHSRGEGIAPSGTRTLVTSALQADSSFHFYDYQHDDCVCGAHQICNCEPLVKEWEKMHQMAIDLRAQATRMIEYHEELKDDPNKELFVRDMMHKMICDKDFAAFWDYP